MVFSDVDEANWADRRMSCLHIESSRHCGGAVSAAPSREGGLGVGEGCVAMAAPPVRRRRRKEAAGDNPVEKDIGGLIDAFIIDVEKHKKPPSFATFRSVWEQRVFSMIHEGALMDEWPWEFTQRLFRTSLRFLERPAAERESALEAVRPASRPSATDAAPEDAPPDLRRVGALFAVYALYHTQHMKTPTRIYLSPPQARALTDIVRRAKRHGDFHDAVRVAAALRAEDAFVFGAVDVSQVASVAPTERLRRIRHSMAGTEAAHALAQHVEKVTAGGEGAEQLRAMKIRFSAYFKAVHEMRDSFNRRLMLTPAERSFRFNSRASVVLPNTVASHEKQLREHLANALHAPRRAMREASFARMEPEKLKDFRQKVSAAGKRGHAVRGRKAQASRAPADMRVAGVDGALQGIPLPQPEQVRWMDVDDSERTLRDDEPLAEGPGDEGDASERGAGPRLRPPVARRGSSASSSDALSDYSDDDSDLEDLPEDPGALQRF